jgi:hypothetical protein
LKQYSAFDYVIINDEIDRACGQLASIIYAERARCMRQEGLVLEVIEKFKSNSDYRLIGAIECNRQSCGQ